MLVNSFVYALQPSTSLWSMEEYVLMLSLLAGLKRIGETDL